MFMRPYGATHTGAHTPRPVCTAQPKHEHQEHDAFTSMHTGQAGREQLHLAKDTHTPNPTTQQWSGAAADPLSVTFLLCSESTGGKLEGW